jgi:hypothetical protein
MGLSVTLKRACRQGLGCLFQEALGVSELPGNLGSLGYKIPLFRIRNSYRWGILLEGIDGLRGVLSIKNPKS